MDPLAGDETLLVRRRSRLLRVAWLGIFHLPDEVARAWPTHLEGGGKIVGHRGRAEASCRQSRGCPELRRAVRSTRFGLRVMEGLRQTRRAPRSRRVSCACIVHQLFVRRRTRGNECLRVSLPDQFLPFADTLGDVAGVDEVEAVL